MKRWTGYCFVFALAGCSTTFSPQPCDVDADCDSGSVCEMRETVPVCVPVDDAPLLIGSSSAISGTNQALGTNMKFGIDLALKEQNEAGGIRGRKLQLVFRDDAYDPDLAEAAARSLFDVHATTDQPRCPSTATPAVAGQSPVSMTALVRGPNAVLAMLGPVGTPTMVRAAPVTIETGSMYFGAFTGANTLLRDDKAGSCKSLIFNIRASYGQEAQAALELFLKKGNNNYKDLVSFDQNDSFGQAGYDGLVNAYKNTVGNFPTGADATTPIFRVRYTRNDDTSVPAQATATESYLASILMADSQTHVIGVFMTDTYGAAATYIQHVRNWQYANDSQQTQLNKANRLVIHFHNVSFVGPNTLSDRLVQANAASTLPAGKLYTDNVYVSQVVPNYENDSTEIVTGYNKLVADAGAAPNFTSLEGYIAAKIFIAGLLNHQGPFLPDNLVASFENLPDLSLGLGAGAGFSKETHQYLQSLWGTAIQADGSFRNLFFWSQGRPIQFFE